MTADAQRKRPALRRLLAWLRIEDEHGVLSLTTAAVLLGAVWLLVAGSLLGLAVFAIGVLGYQAKKHRQYRLAQLGIAGANAHALAQLGNQHQLAMAGDLVSVKALGEKVDKLGKDVRDLATPEKMERIREALGRKT